MSLKIGRRAFLGGAGAVIALPFLKSILPRAARAGAPGAARRLLFFYVPNGMHMAGWTPAGTGALGTLSPILAPLEAVKSKVSVLSGLANDPSRSDGGGDHASGTGGFLTCHHVRKTEGSDIENAVSVDQVAAATLGAMTRFPSLELGIDGGSSAGGCDTGYSCAYARNISWSGAATPLPKSTNPRTVFDRLFEGFDASVSAEEQARRRIYKRSVLDHVRDDAESLRGRLGHSDTLKVDEYLTGIRELEIRLDDMSGASCEPGVRPDGAPDYQAHVRLMSDLMVLAFQCDATRVISFMLGNAGSSRSYPFLGVNEAHHQISHHQQMPANLANLQTIDTWEVGQLAYLLGRLDAIGDGAGGETLLDNSAVFFSSEIEDGDSHSHYNLPIVLAGGGGGAFNPGRHIVYNSDEPVANLFISMLSTVGVNVDTFGDDGTGPLANL